MSHAFVAPDTVLIHDDASIHKMRNAARLARKILDFACSLAQPGVTTDAIDAQVHQAIIDEGAYPSPLNYAGFPKSVCSSINEVICHGIPDMRPLELGDVVSFDVSCFLDGVHGDNCATVICGDEQETVGAAGVDWRGVPYQMDWNHSQDELEARVVASRRLVYAAREGLYASIDVCKPGACLTEVGRAIHAVADEYGFDTVRKYRGHGIAHVFHTAPYVKVCTLLLLSSCLLAGVCIVNVFKLS
jgi:methionyl aminopeptidase